MSRNQVRSVTFDKILLGNNRRQAPAYPMPQFGSGRMTIIILLLVGLVCTGCLFAWTHLNFINQNYEISQIYTEQKELKDVNRKLRVELTNLKSLARLERLAKESYHMAPPEPRQVVVLR